MKPRPCGNGFRLGDNMPLTEQEREWLERRKNICARCSTSYRGRPYFCGRWRDGKCIDFDPKSCIDENVDFEDAAEFEARVAQRLVQNISWPCYAGLCPGGKDMDWQICPKEEWCHMKYARIAVEQEMDDADRS